MAANIERLFEHCTRVDFGTVDLADGQEEFQADLNHVILSLCKSLPKSTQSEMLFSLMKYLKVPPDNPMNFVNYFYVPAWSILYWMIQAVPGGNRLEPEDVQNAKIAHTMAMLLHPLDDHLNDGQLPVTHLNLLLRSQAWSRMTRALAQSSENVIGGEQIVAGYIDEYYSAITEDRAVESIESYCDLFRKQMATCMIVPVLMAKKMTSDESFVHAVTSAYASFGIAWRLLDDIVDIKDDMTQGNHSAIYICLPEDLRNCWDREERQGRSGTLCREEELSDYILENGLIQRINNRICRELESAQSHANDHGLVGLASEFKGLLVPLESRKDAL